MKYFLIYCYKGIPVDVSSFDDEDSQRKQHNHDSNLPDYMRRIQYDSVHMLNQVS